MKNKYKYYIILLSVVSFIWMSDLDYTVRDIEGSSNITLLSSDIYETTLEITVDDFILLPTDSNKYKVYIDKIMLVL